MFFYIELDEARFLIYENLVFKFSEETFDFGEIPQGTPAPHAFTFTNVGKSPLIVSQVDKSCILRLLKVGGR